MPLPLTLLRFPEIHLEKRDAHKLRGYFGNLFKEHSPLLHNHFEDGSARYKYPLVQYKVVQEVPMLVGLNDGAQLLTELFLKINELNIGGRIYPLHQKNLDHFQVHAGLSNHLHRYRFENLWMALNQDNHKRYRQMESAQEKQTMLATILKNNLLSFFKGVDIWLDAPLTATGNFEEHVTKYKNKSMLAFSGEFAANAELPDFIGIGKHSSAGFGTLVKKM